MARLIDADTLCADLRMQWERVFSKTKAKVRPEDFFIKRLSAFQAASISSDIDAFIDYLSSRPTIAAVPVVRCKDCKHSWQDIGGLCCSHGVCVDCTVPEDFFCADGERKTDGVI